MCRFHHTTPDGRRWRITCRSPLHDGYVNPADVVSVATATELENESNVITEWTYCGQLYTVMSLIRRINRHGPELHRDV